ncbi:uncharacterized protein LOC105262481 [Musca domestica]|uniref:Uncharacterized protein LOC105262481 n=1 Tax=Musca domestica TaxID=7370 RepID=A0A9J7DAU7_MUSDO|nr:uncharacterized protein LOC105262481 [Musca domestica]
MLQSGMKLKILFIFAINLGNYRLILSETENYDLQLGRIRTEEVQLEPLGNNQYGFEISLPDSERKEVISLEPSSVEGESPVVTTKGEITTNFLKDNSNLVVNYVADHNGYRASYRFGKGLNDDLGITFGIRLNARDLKSLTG